MALTDSALTTVARMESELGISSASAVLEPLIEEASASFQRECGRNFYRGSAVVEKVKGSGGSRLSLRRHVPLVSITSIVLDDGDTSSTVSASDYEIEDASAGFVRRISGRWAFTGQASTDITRDLLAGTEEPLYVVTYAGGYITPKQEDGGDGTRDLPYDIERAVIDMVKALYYARRRDTGVSSKSVSKASVSYGVSLSDIPNVRTAIESYRWRGAA